MEVKFELFNQIQYIESLTWVNSLQGYDYAAVQAGSNCFCDNDYDDLGKVTEEECNWACTGNGLQFCGGDMRNGVYKTVRTSGKQGVKWQILESPHTIEEERPVKIPHMARFYSRQLTSVENSAKSLPVRRTGDLYYLSALAKSCPPTH